VTGGKLSINNTKILTGNILLLLLYLGCKNNQRSIEFGYFLQLLVLGSQGRFIYIFEFFSFFLMDAEVLGDISGLSTAELFAEIGTRGHNLPQ